jgi:hypothetical protein
MGETWSDFKLAVLPTTPTPKQQRARAALEIDRNMEETEREIRKLEGSQLELETRMQFEAKKSMGKGRNALIPLAQSILLLKVNISKWRKVQTVLLTIKTLLSTANGLEIISQETAKVGTLLAKMNSSISLPQVQRMVQGVALHDASIAAKVQMLDDTLSDLNTDKFEALGGDGEEHKDDGTEVDLLINQALDHARLELQSTLPTELRSAPKQDVSLANPVLIPVVTEHKRNNPSQAN